MPGPAFRHNLEYTRRWTTAHYDYWYFCTNVNGMVFIVFVCLMEQNVITRHFAKEDYTALDQRNAAKVDGRYLYLRAFACIRMEHS